MLKIITLGGRTYNEPAGSRTAEELQHHLTTVEGMRFVHVKEWVRRGARTPTKTTDEDET